MSSPFRGALTCLTHGLPPNTNGGGAGHNNMVCRGALGAGCKEDFGNRVPLCVPWPAAKGYDSRLSRSLGPLPLFAFVMHVTAFHMGLRLLEAQGGLMLHMGAP